MHTHKIAGVAIATVLVVLLGATALKTIAPEETGYEAPDALDQKIDNLAQQDLNCQMQLPNHTGAAKARYDGLDGVCYFQYVDPAFWAGENCSDFEPSEDVEEQSTTIARAMHHSAELCRAGMYEIKGKGN